MVAFESVANTSVALSVFKSQLRADGYKMACVREWELNVRPAAMEIAKSQIDLPLHLFKSLRSSFVMSLLYLPDECIWDRLSINDTRALGGTNPIIAALCDSHVHRRFIALLRKITPEVDRFREVMRRSGAVISG